MASVVIYLVINSKHSSKKFAKTTNLPKFQKETREITMSAIGEKPQGYYFRKDFQLMFSHNTPETLLVYLGIPLSHVAREMKQNTQQNCFAEAERRSD